MLTRNTFMYISTHSSVRLLLGLVVIVIAIINRQHNTYRIFILFILGIFVLILDVVFYDKKFYSLLV